MLYITIIYIHVYMGVSGNFIQPNGLPISSQHVVDPILGLSHTGISLHLFRDKPQGPTNFWMVLLWSMEYVEVS